MLIKTFPDELHIYLHELRRILNFITYFLTLLTLLLTYYFITYFQSPLYTTFIMADTARVLDQVA